MKLKDAVITHRSYADGTTLGDDVLEWRNTESIFKYYLDDDQLDYLFKYHLIMHYEKVGESWESTSTEYIEWTFIGKLIRKYYKCGLKGMIYYDIICPIKYLFNR